jgi:hypothetical protein
MTDGEDLGIAIVYSLPFDKNRWPGVVDLESWPVDLRQTGKTPLEVESKK